MVSKEKLNELNNHMDEMEKNGEILVHKNFKKSMSVQQKFRFNLCLKIAEILVIIPINERHFDNVSLEDSRRIMHKHYDYFTTDRLLEIMNIILISTGRKEDSLLSSKETSEAS